MKLKKAVSNQPTEVVLSKPKPAEYGDLAIYI